VQREPDLKATYRENNSPVKYQCRENVEMLVSTNQDVGFTSAHQGEVGNECDTGELEILGALSKVVLLLGVA